MNAIGAALSVAYLEYHSSVMIIMGDCNVAGNRKGCSYMFPVTKPIITGMLIKPFGVFRKTA